MVSMIKRQQRSGHPLKRRTTLTLPADSLMHAERIARARRVSLSAVLAEALSDGLRIHAAVGRSDEVLSAYKRAFIGLSDEEILVLDGALLEPAAARH